MTEAPEDEEAEAAEVMAMLAEWARRAEFATTEPVVLVPRQVTITRETLETAYVQDILEPVFCEMLEVSTGAEAEAVLASFSLGQRRLYAVEWYVMEVNSGGHEFFFGCSAGLVWPDALAGLEMLGATAAWEILLEATQRFPEPLSVEYSQREEALKKLPDKVFDDLDRRFYDGVDDQVWALMEAYIRAHPDEFLWSGTVVDVEHPYEIQVVDGEYRWVLKAPK
ncbi:MAG: DMP19 family protein [Polyangiaceae bacterium]|nr:DMP19 family protein [Polyangiaceae bacterium]